MYMNISYSQESDVKPLLRQLGDYRQYIKKVFLDGDFAVPESALNTMNDDLLRSGVYRVAETLGEVDKVVLIGIGGSSLGTEAIEAAIGNRGSLLILDTIAPHKIAAVLKDISDTPKDRLAVCVISKSGGTTETLANTETFLDELNKHYGETVYDRTVCIGNLNNPLLQSAEALGCHILPMHEAIGGRYSVFTAVGLVPLKLLGHDIEAILGGLRMATEESYEEIAAIGAVRIFQYLQHGVRGVNFFAFDTRLEKLGYWYRQLSAESLGKEFTIDGEPVTAGFIPTTSTPVELHSIGQLYLSGFKGVFTEFINWSHDDLNYLVDEDSQLAKTLRGRSHQELSQAIYGGVIEAYKERNLPYRVIELTDERPQALGLFMGMRMLETMYLAKLLRVSAFDQPNVELYKEKTREILGL